MNAKGVGQSVRRGILVGAAAGFLAGWGAFAVDGRVQSVAATSVGGSSMGHIVTVRDVPPPPRPPSLPPVPTPSTFHIATAAGSAAPPPLPTIQPLPALQKVQSVPALPKLQPLPALANIQTPPHAVTRTS